MGKREETYNKRRLKVAYISSIFSITAVLFVIGILCTILFSANKISNFIKENLKITLLLQENISETDAMQLKNNISAAHYAKFVELITAEEALKDYQQMTGEDPMDILEENPLLSNISITLTADYANNDSILLVEGDLIANYGSQIKEIQKDSNLIESVNKNLTTIWYVFLALAIFLSLIMVALINHTIRLAIFSKRFLIKTMQLVGATNKFIKAPFLRSGLMQGFIGGVFASIGLIIVAYFLKEWLPGLFNVNDFIIFGAIAIFLITAGLFISYVSTSRAISKYLKLKLDELY